MIPIQSGLNGTNNDDIAINAAILAGRTVCLEGDYHISNKILIPYSGVNGRDFTLISNGATIYGESANMLMLHWADCYGSLLGKINLKANNQGIHLMHLTPELENNNTSVANQNYNYFQSINFIGGDEQLILMAGLPISGTASGCWYNSFGNLNFTSGKRAIWFKDNGSANAASSGSNSNSFTKVTVNGSCNTGIQIDAGGGNKFHNLNLENIQLGSSPNSTPTGIKVANTMTNGGANPDNVFTAHLENVTRHAEINNDKTRFYDSDLDFSLVTGGSAGKITNNGAVACDWTPTLTCESGSIGTSAYRAGKSIKVGRVVTLTGYIQAGTVSSPSGRAYIGNLPYAVSNSLNNRVSCSLFFNAYSGQKIPVMGRISEGDNKIEITEFGSVAGFANQIIQYSDFSFNVTYLTD